MKKLQAGFTMIELVMVIVVLGVLSAVAIPKYVDFKVSAANAATKGMAGALASASAMNYAAHKMNPYDATSNSTGFQLVSTCSGVWSTLLVTVPPSNFIPGGDTGGTVCTVSNKDGGDLVTWNISN